MSSHRRLLSKLKRGLASLFVCLVVLIPLFSLGWWVKYVFIHTDTRKAYALPKFQPRKVDDSPPELFKEPLISVTFDDGWESVYTVAAPLLQKYGIHTTQYIISSTYKQKNYLSQSQIDSLLASGHEIGCHTVTHPDLTSLSDSDLWQELNGCKTTLEKEYHIVPLDFASPYGRFNKRTISEIKKVFVTHRNTEGDFIDGIDNYDINLKQTFDRYNIISITVRRDTPISQLKQVVDYTVKHKGWLVFDYHQVDEGSSVYGLDKKSLGKQLAYLSSTPVKIVTIQQVLNTLKDSK
ncbi:MAG TPA: polysaccharide deacetylase family protein [Candidatus Saccharimonadales bacterium]|nr:polysaccharide deacetylase family protein [Candidatus Saccharimonadales bacterium]